MSRYQHWCEDLDWVRVDDLLEVVRRAAARVAKLIRDVDGCGAERMLYDEIERRIRAWGEARGQIRAGMESPRVRGRVPDDLQVDCIIEAERLTAEDAKNYLEKLQRLVARENLRVVRAGAA